MIQAPLQTFGESAAVNKVIAQAIEYADGAHEIAHVHHRAQLVYATSGIVRVITPLGLWTLTPDDALLIASRVEHELHMVGAVSMRTLYIEPEMLPALERECRVIAVGDLLRASIMGMFDKALEDARGSKDELLIPLILRLLHSTEEEVRDARLPLPAERKLRSICEALIAQPANNDTLERWSERVHASSRTLARLFRQETGMTFGQWREQLRLGDAMSKLAIGYPVAHVAQQLGYADIRTFTVMFKRAFGCTPQQFKSRASVRGPVL